MNQGSFMKFRSRGNSQGRDKYELRKSRWLKYIMCQQEIQLMSPQDNDSLLFFKLKNIFFEEHLDEEQIESVIRESPIKVIDNILIKITDYYNQKVEDIVQIIEDEKQVLLNQLAQNRQKLHHSLEDNEFFKMMIDRLEEERKDIEVRLNQSESEIEKTSQECELMAGENAKIKYSVVQLYENNQQLETENSQLIDHTLFLEREVEALKNHSQQLKLDYNQLFLSRKELEDQMTNLEDELTRLKEDNQNLAQKLSTKESFIASFISQYNKIHFFQHRDPYFQSQRKISSLLDRSNELKGYSFNQFEKDSIILEQASKNDTSCQLDDIQIDSKFAHVSATAEKPKSLTSKAKLCESEEKQQNSPSQDELQIKEVSNHEKNSLKYSFNTRIDQLVEKENQRFGSLTKAVSSENYHLKQNSAIPTEGEGSKLNLEEVLRKKILEKVSKINKLQSEISILKVQYIEEREKITELEGEYQIQVEELKTKLQNQKSQFSKLYQKYVLANSESQIYQEKAAELQDQIKNMEQQHAYYCEQLRQRCKAYIIKRIDEVEFHYQKILAYSKNSQGSPYSVKQVQEEEEGEDVECEESVVEGSLKLRSVDEVDSPEQKKNESSESYSYRHLSNHHINSLHLNLQFSRTQNLNSEKEMRDEVYIKDNFEIESDLGAFTERLKKMQVNHKERGNLTSREVKITRSYNQQEPHLHHLSYQLKQFQVQIDSCPKILDFFTITPIHISPLPEHNIMKIDGQITKSTLKLSSREVEVHSFLLSRSKQFSISQAESISYCVERVKANDALHRQNEDRKYMIHAFQIFESGSTLNTTQNINRSWLKLDCNSFLLNTEQKVEEEHNYTFILEEDDNNNNGSNTDKVSSFGLPSQCNQEELNAPNIYEQSSYLIIDQEIEQKKVEQRQEQFVERIKTAVTLEVPHQLEEENEKSSEFLQSIEHNKKVYINQQQSVQISRSNNEYTDNKQIKKQTKSFQKEFCKIDYVKSIPKEKVSNESLPNLIKETFNKSIWDKLTKFLSSNKLCLKVLTNQTNSSLIESIIGRNHLCICTGIQDEKQATFIMNEKRLLNLEDGSFIKVKHTRVISDQALIFGQSEVIVTNERELTISRRGKLNKLPGNIEDGTWKIKQFVPCRYTVLN